MQILIRKEDVCFELKDLSKLPDVYSDDISITVQDLKADTINTLIISRREAKNLAAVLAVITEED